MQKVVQRSLLDFLQTRLGLFLLVCGAFWCLNTVIGLLQLLITTSTSPLCPHCSQHNYADALGAEGDGYNYPQAGSLIAPNQISYENTLCYPPIDIVYTWVNGSDPRTIHDLAYWKSVESGDQAAAALATALRLVNSTLGSGGNGTEFTDKGDQMSNNRFRDNQELRYSLRSIWKFAPWIRHVFIVTNGHVPYWLNLDHPRVTLISHADIFPNKSHLPTFSSPAIEAHLHRIPGIAEKFIYFNDDVMLGNAITPDDFYTHGQGQKVFLSWNVPNCAPGCPDTWLADRYCDSACNNADCNWDMGDCLNSTSTGGGTKDRYGNWENSRGGGAGANAAGGSSSNARYCSTGCPNNWVGDKVCDRACKNAECAFDGGDCGVDLMRDALPSIQLPYIPPNSQPVLPAFAVPYGTTALYVNLSAAFPGTIVDASHDASSVVRSAIVTQNLKVLTLILYDEADIPAPAAPETSGNATEEASEESTFTEPPFRRIEIFLQGEHQGFLTNVTFNVTRSRFPSPEQLQEAARALEEGAAAIPASKEGSRIVTDPDAMFAGLNAAQAAAEASSGSAASVPTPASTSSSSETDESADGAASEADPAAHAEEAEDAMIPSKPGGRRLLSSFDSLVQTIRHALHRDQQGATVAPPSPHAHNDMTPTPAPRTKPTSEMTREELDAPYKPAAGYHTRAYASAPSAATPHAAAHSSYHASTYSKSTYPAPLYDRWQDVPVFIDGVPLDTDMQRSGVKLREAVNAHENLWMRRDDTSTATGPGSVLTDATGTVLESYGWTQSDYELAARIRAHKQKQLWLLERETARENFLSAWRESQREKRRLLEGKWEEVFEEEMQRSHAAAAEAARRAGGTVTSDLSHDGTSAAASRRPRINRDPVWPWELEVAAPSLFEDWDWSVEASRFSKNQASIRRLMRKMKRKLAAAAAGSEFDGFEFERYDSGSTASSANDDSERIGYGEGVNDDGSVEVDLSSGQGLFGGATGVVTSPSAPAINLAQLGSNIPSAASFSSSLVASSSSPVVTVATEEESHSHEEHADVSIPTNAGPRRQLMDLYGDSLRFVNSLYTTEFGKEQRKAPAHMPHMIDVSIERELQARWPHLFDATSAHRFRHSHDMQYSFSYFYYLMNVPREFNLQQVWDEQLDLNHDGLLDPIEIRYLTLWLSGKKILPRDLVKMNEKLLNVTKTIHGYTHNYFEPADPPRIDIDVIRYSGDILDLIEDKWTSLRKFKFELVNLEQIEFYMVPDNTTKVQLRLDEIRSKMPKFICLNDDMNKTADPPAATLQVLKDFYISYFPLPCPFENAESKPNDFLYIEEYRERKRSGAMSNLMKQWNSFFATLVPSSSDSLPLANGAHAKRHGGPPLLLVSLFVTLLALILLVARQLGLFQKCRSKANLKHKGGHAS